MILGCRFAGRAPDGLWEVAGKHCDIVTVNIYPRVNMDKRAAPGVEEELKNWYALAGRPLAITEWSFPALDSGLPCRNGAGMRVDSQSQRSLCVAVMQDLFFRLPFVVGTDFFMWADEPALGISSTFPEDSNYGLVNEKNEPYDLLTRTFSRVNADAFRLHAGQLARSTAIDELAATASATTLPDEPLPVGVATKVTFKKTDGGFEVTNGPLKLVKGKTGGDALDRIEFEGKLVGRFSPMIWQKTGRAAANHWVSPDKIESIADSRLKDGSLVLDVVLVKAESPGPDPIGGYRVCFQLVVPPATSWFTSRLMWVENAGKDAWTMAGYYHAARSGLPSASGDVRKEEPVAPAPNYWLPVGAWYDAAASTFLGVTAEPGADIEIIFWKDKEGRQHPDAHRKIGVVLADGQRYDQPQPTVYVFAARGPRDGEGSRPWARVIAQARRWQGQASP
jgi:hypothetical protein